MSAQHLPTEYRAVLLDIEGTTTSISFVYDMLFPYVRNHVKEYLDAHWEDPALQEVLVGLRAQVQQDLTDGLEDIPRIPDGARSRVVKGVVANVHWQMVSDRKTTALKTLQGMIWVDGYTSGELKGHVFDDVPEVIRGWTDRGLTVHLYSSGSVAAQKLLFRHSIAGDLTPLLSGYYDTTTGSKREPASYARIADDIGVPPKDILFVTDVLPEAEAARRAGFRPVLAIRKGNVKISFEHGFLRITSLTPLLEAL